MMPVEIIHFLRFGLFIKGKVWKWTREAEKRIIVCNYENVHLLPRNYFESETLNLGGQYQNFNQNIEMNTENKNQNKK